MPKAAGSEMKTTRRAPLPQPKPRPIMHQVVPSGPKVDPMSPGAPKFADQLKSSDEKNTGSVDPRQQLY